MFGYVVRRVVAGITVLFMVVVATFTIFFLGPADPAYAICGDRNCTPERLVDIRASLGLDKPKCSSSPASSAASSPVGRSRPVLSSRSALPRASATPSGQDRPVTAILVESLPVTISVALGAAVIFLTVGSAPRCLRGSQPRNILDKGLVGISLTYELDSVLRRRAARVPDPRRPDPAVPADRLPPVIGEGPFCMVQMGHGLLWPGWSSASSSPRRTPGSAGPRWWRPWARTSSERRGPRACRSGGSTSATRCASALAPVVTIFGLDLASLLAGTIFTERIFNLKGIGYMAITAVQASTSRSSWARCCSPRS